MSVSEDTDSSKREKRTTTTATTTTETRTTENCDSDMGVVLAKSLVGDPEEDSRIPDERQDADGAADPVDDFSTSEEVSRLSPDTTQDTPPDDLDSEDTALRIEALEANNHFPLPETMSESAEHSLECTAACPTDCFQHPDKFCPCDSCKLCKLKRAIIDDERKLEIKWNRLLTEIRDHIRWVFEDALDATVVPNNARYQCDPCRLRQLRENVIQMCKRNSKQLLRMLIVQAQEFVNELKNRIKETLDDLTLPSVAEIFLTQIVDCYDALVSTAKQVTDLLKPVEELHLMKFNLTWEFFNKALYENHIWASEPSMRSVTCSFTTQLTMSRKRNKYLALFERYVVFVEEMMRVADLWPETERLIVKWNDKRAADRVRAPDIAPDTSQVSSSTDIVPKSQDESEGSDEKEIDENTPQSTDAQPLVNGIHASPETDDQDLPILPSNDSVVESASPQKESSRPREQRKGLSRKDFCAGNVKSSPIRELIQKRKTDIAENIAELNILDPRGLKLERGSRVCQCVSKHLDEIHKTGDWLYPDSPCPCVRNLNWLCGVARPCPCQTAASTVKAITQESPESLTSTTSPTTVQKPTKHSTTQTASPSKLPADDNSNLLLGIALGLSTAREKRPNASPVKTHNHSAHHQGRSHSHLHGPSPDPAKNPGPNHRPHTHNNHASHTCLKQARIEQRTRALCNDLGPGDGDCSDSVSSQEDSCSTSSSVPRDSNRHCDCCYCEVFGPGLPPVAPVGRNYNEMRERLRQLLTKRKAKKCKVPCSPPKSPVEAPAAVSSTSAPDQKITAPLRVASSRSNTPIAVSSTNPPEKPDERDLDALLEFIEGNEGTKKDNKKTEKKARQKQRKVEEVEKKTKEEADRQKLIELQKKTPEVTITVVDPQKPISQRLPKRNLPEVSILPAMAPPAPMLTAQKQANAGKKKTPASREEKAPERSSNVGHSNNANKGKNVTIFFPLPINDPAVSEKTKKGSKSDEKVGKKSKNEKVETVQPSAIELPEAKLTKKERKKLRREMKKLEETKENMPQQRVNSQVVDNNQPQIVTIKRVMESHSAEPTVTITLKGQTPAEDKVLFTLVNGQTKESGASKAEPVAGSKKKKEKGNNQASQQSGKPVTASKNAQKTTEKNDKSQASDKSKVKKVEEKKVLQENQQNIVENNGTKSKKEKKLMQAKKSAESKQAIASPLTSGKTKNTQQQQHNQQQKQSKQQPQQKDQQQQQQKNQQPAASKKQSKSNAPQQTQAPTQKSQSNAHSASDNSNKKKSKAQQQDANQGTSSKTNKKVASKSTSNENTKNRGENQSASKQPTKSLVDRTQETRERDNNGLLSSQLKNVGPNTKLNIENLKLPPGITITKVDAPTKSLPLKSAPMPKPVTATKQTTIIAAPMSGVQSSYAGSQSGGNVIVVDTGKLKQDLLPKNSDKTRDTKNSQQADANGQSGGKKKQKKKGKNGTTTNSGTVTNGTKQQRGGNDSGKENGDESARIVHNPDSNMVTIRNPAFGPAPKIETAPQAAIIKVLENGMVTIRSPALQQAINAGLTPPPKPDFIVKGDAPSNGGAGNVGTSNSSRATLSPVNSINHRNTNGIISTSLAEFRSRLSQPDCTSLPGLANIQISKVTNGQPIPERGINLKGTNVTLTKVRNPDMPATTSLKLGNSSADSLETINASINAPSSKGKKKKKRGNGAKNSGDDWNLVESVFTPKDIEDGEMDDAERELEAFKRFCLQSVPPPRKEKVNLNIKDIVLKKKSSSGAAIAAN